MQGWLRNPAFDSVFIIGLSAIALAAGAIVLNDPTRFRTVLILDLWLLGFHHVISTYTRLAFDAESFRQHKALVLYLPIGVFLATGLIGASFGAQALTTIYLYWQWYHYTRQSEGISKAYARKSEHHAAGPCLITKITFWIVPLDGLVNLSFKAPGVFLGLPVYTLPVPFELVFIMDCAAVVCLALWSYRQIQAMQNGTLSIPYVLYLTSHFVIYYVAYVLIHFVDTGWLVINIWHNAQYIAFVWLFNQSRFKNGIDPRHKFISAISQPNRLVIYLVTCLAISTAVYYSVDIVTDWISIKSLPLVLIIYQTINFHHYIVDAVIWKLRKKTVRATLGLS